jgi:hypothetical protein
MVKFLKNVYVIHGLGKLEFKLGPYAPLDGASSII